MADMWVPIANAPAQLNQNHHPVPQSYRPNNPMLGADDRAADSPATRRNASAPRATHFRSRSRARRTRGTSPTPAVSSIKAYFGTKVGGEKLARNAVGS